MSSYKNYKTLNELGNTAPKVDKNQDETKKENFVIQVPHITSLEDKEALLKNNKLVVIDVYADWCGPCQTTGPLFAELYNKYKDYCILVKENVDLRLSPTVQVIPTFQIFVDGKLKSQITGANLSEVEDNIKAIIS